MALKRMRVQIEKIKKIKNYENLKNKELLILNDNSVD
jgi:ribosomal protein L20A (L18A)